MKHRSKQFLRAIKKHGPAYLFLLPNFGGLIAFTIYPILFAFFMSFTDWNLFSPAQWVGLANYKDLFTWDPFFWKTMGKTLYYVVLTVPGGIVIGLMLALLMNRAMRGITIFRSAVFIPQVMSLVTVSVIWRWLYNTDIGLFNYILSVVGLPTVDWLTSEAMVMPSIAIMSIWKGMGYNAVIFLAGLKAIPSVYYEAARIDGASNWRMFWSVTLPLITPSLFFIGVMSSIGAFQVFAEPFVMTNGGPGDASRVYGMYIYQNAFRFFDMGYASAMSYVLFVVILIFTIIQLRVTKSGGEDISFM